MRHKNEMVHSDPWQANCPGMGRVETGENGVLVELGLGDRWRAVYGGVSGAGSARPRRGSLLAEGRQRPGDRARVQYI